MRDYFSRVGRIAFLLTFLSLLPYPTNGWGFYAHRTIIRLAVFGLPPEMFGFYKRNVSYLTEEAVAPDRRRYAVPDEAPRHYIDIDVYGDSAVYTFPRYWQKAVEEYTEDTLMAYGIVPWYIDKMAYRLTLAFQQREVEQILKLSADIGHYIGDANVPLHTTQNYNGQLTDQHGIHGLWESRLPELFSEDYNLFIGSAAYIDNIQLHAWEAVTKAHEALDSVLLFEAELSGKFKEGKKYAYEERGTMTVKVYSREFCEAYQQLLYGQVERQMKASIKMTADIWYTCWVNAGQPDLERLSGNFPAVDSLQTENLPQDEIHH